MKVKVYTICLTNRRKAIEFSFQDYTPFTNYNVSAVDHDKDFRSLEVDYLQCSTPMIYSSSNRTSLDKIDGWDKKPTSFEVSNIVADRAIFLKAT
ncbi:hypothetical protein H5410_054212 [Solanum commersonii]|uniref:Uncharacterized protein n=1 Tax=Solanum commersonii TaxID=4109 RepID=A0A9J5X5L0_SOLCO|nr:hypothetical protein H5410_054212 [Solanum commersonii]